MFFDSIDFADFEAFLSINDVLEHFRITSIWGVFTSDSPRVEMFYCIWIVSPALCKRFWTNLRPSAENSATIKSVLKGTVLVVRIVILRKMHHVGQVR